MKSSWLLNAIPAWMALIIILIVIFTIIFFRTIHTYHEDLVSTLERIMMNQSNAIRLLFQFIMDKREPEFNSVLHRLAALEKHTGLQVTEFPLPDKARGELVAEIQGELDKMKKNSQISPP